MTDASCLNVDPLLVPIYLGYIPRDELEPCVPYTGLKVYQESQRPFVFPSHLGKMPGDTLDSEPCGTPEPPTIVPVDVKDPSLHFSACSVWTTWTGSNTPEGYFYNYLVKPSTNQTPSDCATCVLSGMTPGNSYEFFVTWVPFPANVPLATYNIHFGSPSVLQATVQKPHQVSPNDAQYGGVLWESLGTYTVTSSTASVKLQDIGTGDLIFDAVAVVAR